MGSALSYLHDELKSKNTMIELGYTLSKQFDRQNENEKNIIEYLVVTVLDGLVKIYLPLETYIKFFLKVYFT